MHMRKVCLKALLLVLAFVGLQGLTTRAQAQQAQVLIQFTNSWRYDPTGRDLGTAWRANNYTEDASWRGPSPGLIGFEDVQGPYLIHAPFSTPISAVTTITTYYFRATFNFAGNPLAPGLSLVATNLVDDGCAIFLNGSLVGGVRAPATFTAATFFPAPAAEGQLDVVTFTNLSALRNGANLIAVEVHQSANPSSDMVFGMKLTAFTPQTLNITNQPLNQSLAVGDTLTLTVGVSGGPVAYQWQKNGINLNNATNATYSQVNVPLNAAGDYRVIVTNVVSTNISSVATVTVVEDNVGPEIVRAIINNNNFGSNTINVFFNEGLSATGRNTNNYRLVSVANPAQSYYLTNILGGSLAQGALLYVGDPAFDPRGSYYLIVNNVSDLRGNFINPNSTIGVGLLVVTNLTQISDTWNYYDCGDPDFCDPGGPALYANQQWYRTNFVINPIYWGSGGGIFARESGTPFFLCAGDQINTTISFQLSPTLFRRTFRLPAGSPATGQLRLRYIFDDGMVVYLNGQPIHYANIAVGPITANSRALTNVSESGAVCYTNITVNVTNLYAGTNWLAVAVCQGDLNSGEGDTVFGLEMDLVSTVTAPVPQSPATQPTITRTRTGTNFVLRWPTNYYGYALQYSTNITGTNAKAWVTNLANWHQVKDQSNPYTNPVPPTTGPRRFYIIREP